MLSHWTRQRCCLAWGGVGREGARPGGGGWGAGPQSGAHRAADIPHLPIPQAEAISIEARSGRHRRPEEEEAREGRQSRAHRPQGPGRGCWRRRRWKLRKGCKGACGERKDVSNTGVRSARKTKSIHFIQSETQKGILDLRGPTRPSEGVVMRAESIPELGPELRVPCAKPALPATGEEHCGERQKGCPGESRPGARGLQIHTQPVVLFFIA